MFHIEAANSMMVRAVGTYLRSEKMVQGKKWSEREDTAELETGRVGAELQKAVVAGNGRREVPRQHLDLRPNHRPYPRRTKPMGGRMIRVPSDEGSALGFLLSRSGARGGVGPLGRRR